MTMTALAALRRSALLAAAFSFLLVSCPAPAEDTARDNLVLGNENVALTVTPEGRFVSIRDKRIGADFVSNWASEGNAWVAYLPDKKTLTASEAGPAACTLKTIDGVETLSMHWKPAGPAGLDVKCTVRLVGEDQFEFSATLANGPEAPEVQQFCFPAHFGWDKTADGWVMIPVNYSGMCYPFKDVKPTRFNAYPSVQIMQLVGVRHGRAAATIYAADDQGYTKFAMLDASDTRAMLNYRSAVWVKPGQSWTLPFPYVVKLIPDGDQTALCKAYRQWSRQQWWFEKTVSEKLIRTPGLAAMINGYVRLGGIIWTEEGGRYRPRVSQTILERIETVRDLRENYGHDGGAWSPAFSWMFGSRYPDYFPIHPDLGTDADFLLFNEILNTWGVPVMYHMNPINWNDYAPSFRKDWIADWRERGGYTHISPPAGTRKYYFMSPLVTLHKDLRTIHRMIEEFHASGFYFDMIGHTFMHDDNPLAGYPPETIGRNNLGQMKKQVFERIRAQAPSQVLMTEIGNEMTLPQLDMLFGGDITALQVDISEAFAFPAMWQMVYGDAIVRTWSWRDDPLSRNLQALIGSNYCWQRKPRVYSAHIQRLVSRQKVMRQVIGTEMLHFDKSDARMSSTWPGGMALVAMREDGTGELDTPVGKVAWSNINAQDLLMVTADGSFIARDIIKLTRDGKTLLNGTTSGVEIINHPAGVALINSAFTSAKVDVSLQPAGGKTPEFATLQINGNKARTPWPIEGEDGKVTIVLNLPPRSSARLRWVRREQRVVSTRKAIEVQLGKILTSLDSLPPDEKQRKAIDHVTTLRATLATDPDELKTQIETLGTTLAGLPAGKGQPMVTMVARPVRKVQTYLRAAVAVIFEDKTYPLGETVLGGRYGAEPRDLTVDLSAFAGQDVQVVVQIPSSHNRLFNRGFGIFEPRLVSQDSDENLLPVGQANTLASLMPTADAPGLRAFVPGPKLDSFQGRTQPLLDALNNGYVCSDAFLRWPPKGEPKIGLVPNIPREYTQDPYKVVNGTPDLDASGSLYYIQSVKVPPLDYPAEIDRMINWTNRLAGR